MVARVYAAFVAAWRLVYLHVHFHISILCMQPAMWSQQPGWAGESAFNVVITLDVDVNFLDVFIFRSSFGIESCFSLTSSTV